MLTTVLLTSLAVAGAAVLWRNLSLEGSAIHEWLYNHTPKLHRRALLCGFCFTYWLALAATILFDPFHGWLPDAYRE